VIAVVAYVVTVVHAATTRALAARREEQRPEESLVVWPKWLTALVVGLLAVWLLYRVRGILLPFIVGAVMAYLLNPAIDRLAGRGWTRTQAIGLVFGIFLAAFVVLALGIVPIIAAQAQDLAGGYQTYLQEGRELAERMERAAVGWAAVVGLVPEAVRQGFEEVGDKAQAYALAVLRQLPEWLSRSLAVVSLLVITPIVTFWLLRDYHDLGRHLLRALPEQQRERLLVVLRDVNQVAGGYLLGMVIMAAIVAAWAVVVLTVGRVPFAVLLGIMTGVFYTIPYIGYPAAVVIIGLTMLVTGKGLAAIVIVLAVMIAGNLIADYGLYPRIVGRRVGLHPLTVIFAMLAGGALLGFLGVVLAVPLAGTIKAAAVHFWPEVLGAEQGEQRGER
jgi:predicted PurR-regulated permease PerM